MSIGIRSYPVLCFVQHYQYPAWRCTVSRQPTDPLRPLTAEERASLEQLHRAQSAPAVLVARATLILAVADGATYTAAARAIGRRSNDAVAHLVRRFNRLCLKSIRFSGDDLRFCRCDSIPTSSDCLSVMGRSVRRSPIQRIRMAQAAGRRSVVGPVVKWAALGWVHRPLGRGRCPLFQPGSVSLGQRVLSLAGLPAGNLPLSAERWWPHGRGSSRPASNPESPRGGPPDPPLPSSSLGF